MSEANKGVVRKLEEAWNQSDFDTVAECLTPDFESHSTAPGVPANLEGFKGAHAAAMKAFPDRKVAIEDLFGEGDLVVSRARIKGTNTGGAPFLGVPEANGRPIDVQFIAIYRIADGKVAEMWALNDAVKLLQDLGAMPAS